MPFHQIFDILIITEFVYICFFATPWTVALQAMEFSRQEYWNGLPFPYPGDLPDPGIEPASLLSPVLAGRLFTTSTTWEVGTSIIIPILQIRRLRLQMLQAFGEVRGQATRDRHVLSETT